MVLSNGMIHPDEYFQSQEVMATDVFSLKNTFIPWEWYDVQFVSLFNHLTVALGTEKVRIDRYSFRTYNGYYKKLKI